MAYRSHADPKEAILNQPTVSIKIGANKYFPFV
jgi:hypothetical protein